MKFISFRTHYDKFLKQKTTHGVYRDQNNTRDRSRKDFCDLAIGRFKIDKHQNFKIFEHYT